MSLPSKRCMAVGVTFALLMAGGMAQAHFEFVPSPDPVPQNKPLADRDDRPTFLFSSFEESVPPPGWTMIPSGNSTTWEQTDQASNSGTYSAAVFYGPQGAFQDEWLVTPALHVSAAVMLFLEFYEMAEYWEDYGLRHHIAVSTTVPDDPGAFTMVETWTPANHEIPSAFGGDPVTVDLSDYIGERVIYVAFRYEGDWADNWFIDDVRIYEPGDHDVAAVDALPQGHVEPGELITPQAVVKNVGLNAETFDVEYGILENSAVIYSEIASMSNLDPGVETTVDFPGFLPEAGAYYETHVTTLLGTDEEPFNDEVWGGIDTYMGIHVPIMFLFTNSGCGPCAPANQAMDAYMPDQGNSVALMRIHTWWPNPNDIMYTYNTEQCDAYIDEYGVNGVPDFWLDGIYYVGHNGADAVSAFEEAKTWASPMSVTPVSYSDNTLTVEVDIQAPLPPGTDLHLVCCFTEDNIEHNGGNGEPLHHQAFRYAYPNGLEGMPISGDIGFNIYEVEMPLDPNGSGDWDIWSLRATCYAQDRGDREFRHIIQSGTTLLTEIMDLTSVNVDASAPATRILGSYPNPFNPRTTICFAQERAGPVQVSIFDLQGRLVTTLFKGEKEAGEHVLVWNGTDADGNAVGSSVYLVNLETRSRLVSRKIVLTK